MTTHSYTTTATRNSNGWFVQCDQHPALTATVRVLERAANQQRRALSIALQVPEEEINVEVRPVLPADVHGHLKYAEDLRRTATWANRASAAQVRAAARILAYDEELSLRDIGTILGVSFQRAHQILHGPSSRRSPTNDQAPTPSQGMCATHVLPSTGKHP